MNAKFNDREEIFDAFYGLGKFSFFYIQAGW